MSDDREEGMTLGELQRAGGLDGRLRGPPDVRVTGVQHDSRRVAPGDLFVAIPGETHDGVRFAADAFERGAAAVLSEVPVAEDIPQLTVPSARAALGPAAEIVYGAPTSALHTVGITGTNGKTTTAYLVKKGIDAASGRAALVGTTGMVVGDLAEPSLHTTPEADDISRFAHRSLDAGATHLVLEVSSHGLALHRVDAVSFEVAAFTNLSRDHLDFHGTFEAYGRAKAKLFTKLTPKHAVIHIDDPFGAELAHRASGSVIRCSRRRDAEAEILATEWSATREGIAARVETPSGVLEFRSPMLGEHNLENALVALGCAYALDLDLQRVASAWEGLSGTPGRLERISHPGDVAVLVDYAHTPDALRKVLETMRAVTPGRLMVVFGAGGDRDRGKRPEMGRVAAETADVCVLTSDNPRTEEPQAILDSVEAGASSTGSVALTVGELAHAAHGHCSILDRRAAIRIAIEAAQPGDTVLLAGKGHETYQIVGTTRAHFDDREEAREAIESLGGKS